MIGNLTAGSLSGAFTAPQLIAFESLVIAGGGGGWFKER